MTLVALCSLKGSPGVTTTALGLASHWPTGQTPVVVECDPAGGDVLARFRLGLFPGLVSLAAAARRADDPDLLWQHIQRLRGGLRVVVGPPGAEQARAALEQLIRDGETLLRGPAERAGTVVIADCGRAEAHSLAMPVLRQADVTLVLARARDDALAHVAVEVDALRGWSSEPVLVLVGDGYGADEVTSELGITVLARLPEDPRGAALLRGTAGRRAATTRSALGKVLTSVARQLAERGLRASEQVEVDVTVEELAAPSLRFTLPADGRPVRPAPSTDGATP
ncbi:hypothetical protein [Streptomyces sp. NRRL B-1347]|uniref:hypothetical protein n=1 Tax=Streptomyces sp. NRRL B-1347 TaxID=1476877 RepID=UPI0006896FA7|nr:hypothetical protein [Streptomyces sp. NRRL B-1347]